MRIRLWPAHLTSTTRRWSGFVRALAGVLALLQLSVGAALPLLDAEASHHQPVASHIEDATQNDCPEQHHAASCQLCQLLTSARLVPAGHELPTAPVAEPRLVPVASSAVATAAAFLDGRASRAPPLG